MLLLALPSPLFSIIYCYYFVDINGHYEACIMCNEVKQHCSDKQYRCTAPLRKQDIQFDDQQNKTKSSFRVANHKQG